MNRLTCDVDRRPKAEVLGRINSKCEQLECIKKRKTAYCGHVVRLENYELLVEGHIEGRKGMGTKQTLSLRYVRN